MYRQVDQVDPEQVDPEQVVLVGQGLDPDLHHNHHCKRHTSQKCKCTRRCLADGRPSTSRAPADRNYQHLDIRKQ